MYIRNLTPHSVTVAGITIEPSGIVARVSAATADAGSVDFNGTTIPLTTTVYGEVQNLPAQRDDTLLIVSSLVAARCMTVPTSSSPMSLSATRKGASWGARASVASNRTTP